METMWQDDAPSGSGAGADLRLVFALTYGESRKRIFACSECGARRVTHTAISALFLVCYVLLRLLLAGCALLIAWLLVSTILNA